jgi:formiminoglutamase
MAYDAINTVAHAQERAFERKRYTMMERYEAVDMAIWKGRVDSHDSYDAFRWHQWVRQLNLNSRHSKVFDGKLGFALLGFCCDEGIRRNQGRVGARNGPDAIRKELANLPCSFSRQTTLFDAGNIWCLDQDLKASQNALAKAVTKIRELGLFPLVLGGGHETALGHYWGHRRLMEENNLKPAIGIVNFDAHFDLRPLPVGGSSGTMFREIADECVDLGLDFNYLCLGIQKYCNTEELFKRARELGAVYLLEKDIHHRGESYVINNLDKFLNRIDDIYITVCADVFSSAFAPGVSASQPFGINPEDALKYIKHIIRSGKVVGFDIAEVSPQFDQDNTTANLAKVLLFTFVRTICKLKGLSTDWSVKPRL